MEASLDIADAAASANALTSDHHQLHETISCFCDPQTKEVFRLSGCSNLTDFLACFDSWGGSSIFLACFDCWEGSSIFFTGELPLRNEVSSDDELSNVAVDKSSVIAVPSSEVSSEDELSNVAVDDISGIAVVGTAPRSRPSSLYFCVERVRSLEERREAGSFLCFLRALATSCTKLSLGNVYFQSDEELSAFCQGLASPLCKVEILQIGSSCVKVLTSSSNSVSDASCVEAAWPRMAEFLLHNSTSLTTSKYFHGHNTRWDLMYSYHHPACETPHRQLRVKTIYDTEDEDLFGRFYTGLWAALANNTSSLQEISVCRYPSATNLYGALPEETLCQILAKNVSLTSLTLGGMLCMSGKGVQALFTSLEKNLNLNHLSLVGCHGEDWPSITWVLDSIRINGIITQLDLEGTPLDSQSNKAAIEIQLAKNRANVESLKVLQSEGSTHATQLVQPTSVRFFLCGFPYSGKTTLSTSLAKYWTKPIHHFSLRSRLTQALDRSPERTQGIKVTKLNKDGVKISLWDLAGQKEFHVFHDYMLPSFANEATPSMFLFVWSPIYVDEKTGREQREGPMNQLKTKGAHNFRQDFKYWLTFIASKTLKSLNFRPKVFVVITREDKIERSKLTKGWVKGIIDQLQREFKEYLDLDVGWVFEIDARYPYAVEQLALHVFDAASNLLKSVPLVYKACDDARRLLSNIAHKRHLMTKDEFFHICGAWLSTGNKEIHEAITHNLSSTGDLIYFKSTLLVIVDVEWFCHRIMGRLLNSDMAAQNIHPEQGVWPLHCLQELLVEKAEANSGRGKNRNFIRVAFMERRSKSRDVRQKLVIKGEDLANILIELGVACPLQDGEPGIFIPASLRTYNHQRIQIEPRDYLTGDRQGIKTYMGRRLRCKDTICTFFTPGFFPALQVKFRALYSSTTKHGSDPVAPTTDVIAFAREGVEVFMEFCHPEAEGQFIDILVQSHKDRDGTIKWIHERVLEHVEQVRAGSRGLQGVELAHEVVRPACVENLDGLEERKTQAVSLEELRASLKSHLEQEGSLAKFADNYLESALHTWHTAGKCVSHVIDLLGSEETGRIVESFRQQVVMELNDALGVDIESEVLNVEEPESLVFSSALLTGGSHYEQLMVHGMGEMHKDIRKVYKSVQELQKDVRKIVASLDTIHNVALPKLQQRVQELLNFSKEGEAGRLPRFFVVTEGKGSLRKIVATVVPGLENVRLQIMCEHGRHLLGDNYGLTFQTLEDGYLKRGLPYIITVLKVIRVAARVGAHVFAGLGDAVPDLTRGLALIIDTPNGLPAYSTPDAPLKSSASRTNFQEGQEWLRDILDMHNCKENKQIHDKFGLTCVIYRDSRVKWLCDEHRPEDEHWCL